MPGIIFQPQTLFSIGVSRQFGGITNPSGEQTNPALGNQGQPIFKGYVTVRETTVDALEITQQPVQQGAPISDHAFKKPVTLSIEILMGSELFGQSLSTIYQSLLNLQSSFVPFNCMTPKRTYYNMLFQALGMTTDKSSENILALQCTFAQIITVPVGITTVPRSQLSNPGRSGQTQNAGKKNLQSALVIVSKIRNPLGSP